MPLPKLLFRPVRLLVVVVPLAWLPVQAAQEISTKDELIQALSEVDIRIGMVLWLRLPMGDLPGLTKLTVRDADIRQKYSFSNQEKHLVLVVDAEGKGQSVLEISRYTFSYDAKDTAENFYLQDPAKQVSRWGKRVLKAIAEREVIIGMTPEQVIASWGKPTHIGTSVGSWGRHEQWVFGESNSSYLYFENGKLTSWQN